MTTKEQEVDVELLEDYPRWICESCMDTGRVLTDGSSLSWVIYDPCTAPDCPFENTNPV